MLQKLFFTRGDGMQVVYSNCFFVDNTNNILISDFQSSVIHIFNFQYELIHKIKTSKYTMGVVINDEGKVIVVCQADNDCLQIF